MISQCTVQKHKVLHYRNRPINVPMNKPKLYTRMRIIFMSKDTHRFLVLKSSQLMLYTELMAVVKTLGTT